MLDICVILCGGKSSRMGENKIFMPFGDSILIIYQYKQLSNIFKNVFISSKNIYLDSIIEAFKKANISIDNKIILEEDSIYSPLFGVKNAFDKLNMENIFFISCDSPFIKSRIIHSICENANGYDITCIRDRKSIHPLIGLWNKRIQTQLQEAIENNKFKIINLLKQVKSKILYFDYEFLNINTKEDYKKALLLLEENK